MRGIGWLLWGLILGACGGSAGSGEEERAPAPEEAEEGAVTGADAETGALRAPAREAEREAAKRAEAAATALGARLRAELTQAMSEGGPQGAVAFCADQAQGLTALEGQTHRARVGRTSDRVRNPQNGGPDWALAQMNAWKAGDPEGVAPVVGIAQDGEGEVARVMRPIRIEAPCLSCHGAKEALPDEVAAVITERYPSDQATGYALGELRGVLWAEVPVATP